MEHLQHVNIYAQLITFIAHVYITYSVLKLGSRINTNSRLIVSIILLYTVAAILIVLDLCCYFRGYGTIGFYGSVAVAGFFLTKYLRSNKDRLASI